MSYLPRMSKTYKEPQEPISEEPDEQTLVNTLKPASSLLNEKTHNPLMILKHYKYLPHAPPVLPGPSVLEEAMENELYREACRMRRSTSKMAALSKTSQSISEQSSVEPSETALEENKSKIDVSHKVKRSHSKKTIKGSKSSVGKKKSSKTAKKESTSNAIVNMCLLETRKPFTAGNIIADSDLFTKDELFSLKREKSVLPITSENDETKEKKLPVMQVLEEEKPELQAKLFKNRSVQCSIFGSFSKLFVISSVINPLLRTLAFLLQEINKEEALNCISGERKTLVTQIQLILGDLCNQKAEKEIGFDLTYSDSKRLEKILGDLKKYLTDVYGDKGEYIDKMEDLKRVFIELKKKEMELAFLEEKLEDAAERPGEVVVNEVDLKNPEITLQNKRLESEQLLAEVEFSCIELRNCQKAIAELDWDIRHSQEQMASLKKSLVSKSKTEMFGRKSSTHKFSCETMARVSKSKESENSFRKKT